MKEITLITALLFLIFSGLVACTSSSQTAETEADIAGIDFRMPSIIGGQEMLYRNMQYPDRARRDGIEGRVMLEFMVHEDGSVHDIEVLSTPSDLLSRAAIDALRKVEFRPAVRDGEFIKMAMPQPVIFRISN